jgi:hypothetical protein
MQDEGALVVPPAFITRVPNDLRFAITGIPDLLYGKRLKERRPCRSNLGLSYIQTVPDGGDFFSGHIASHQPTILCKAV